MKYTLHLIGVLALLLIADGCVSPVEQGDDSQWWPQEVGWNWLYEATDGEETFQFEVRIEDTAEYGGKTCYVNEFGDYDAHEGELNMVYPDSNTAYEIWDQKSWIEVEGFWVELELCYTDPLTVHISGTLNSPVTDTGEGDVYLGGFHLDEFEVTLTSETVETGVEMEIQGNTYSEMRKVKYTLETVGFDPVVSYGYFKQGVGLVRGEDLWDYGVLELISYEEP
ncbi:hypothetical protein KAU45_03155 [bacterium]|nr:hypothetical protein [bacterium]